MTQTKTTSTRFGSTARPDIWEKDTKNDIPGPGLYVSENNTFGKAAKGGAANMGSKYKPEKNDNPGPCQYVVNDPTLTSSKNQKISQAQRKDIWEEQTKHD